MVIWFSYPICIRFKPIFSRYNNLGNQEKIIIVFMWFQSFNGVNFSKKTWENLDGDINKVQIDVSVQNFRLDFILLPIFPIIIIIIISQILFIILNEIPNSFFSKGKLYENLIIYI